MGGYGRGFQGEGGGGKALGGGGDLDSSSRGGGAEDGDGVALVEMALGGVEGIMVEEVAVVDGEDGSGASGGEVDEGGGVGEGGSVGINQGGGDVGQVVPVGGEGGGVGGEDEVGGLSGGAEGICGYDFAVGAGDGLEGAGGEGDLEGDGGGVGVKLLGAEGLAVEEEFDLLGVGVDFDVLGVGLEVGGGPIDEEGLAEAGGGVGGQGCGLVSGGSGLLVGGGGGGVAGVDGALLGGLDAAGDADHRGGGPPGLALEGSGTGEGGGEEESGAGTDGGPATGFAEVVHTGPEELSGVLGVVAHGDPLVAVVGVLGPDDAAGGFVGVGFEDLLLAVVLADDVEEVGEAVVVVAGDVGAEESLGDGAGGVVVVEGFDEGFEDGDGDFGVWGVVDLVAGGVEDDAGVVAVALHGVGGIDEGPLAEVEMVVVGVLGDGPGVEHLVHDEESHVVAEVEELRRGWVVGGADGVDAQGTESGEAELPGGEWDSSAQGSGVGVEGYSEDLVVGSVEEKAQVGIEVELTDAEGDGFFVDGLFVLHEGCVDRVEGGVVEVPAVGGG